MKTEKSKLEVQQKQLDIPVVISSSNHSRLENSGGFFADLMYAMFCFTWNKLAFQLKVKSTYIHIPKKPAANRRFPETRVLATAG